jgi:hypothetical protein
VVLIQYKKKSRSIQDRIQILSPLKKLHTIEMVVVHNHTLHNPRVMKSYSEIDTWLSAARGILEGNEGNGQGHKEVKLHYRWVNWLIRGMDGRRNEEERFVEVQVE